MRPQRCQAASRAGAARSRLRGGAGWLLGLALLLSAGISPPALAEAAAKKPGRPACNHAAYKVVLDVGHTSDKVGARSARGVGEYDFNLALTKQIEKKLLDAGFARTVLLVTADPPPLGLVRRAARANRLGADLFLSIHHDSVPEKFLQTWEYLGEPHAFSDQFKGHSLFVSPDNGDFRGSLLFGKMLGRQLKTTGLQYASHYVEKFMEHKRRQLLDAETGVYRFDQLAVLKFTRMPAVLLEAGSIINRDEELVMASHDRRVLIAEAVTAAVEEFCTARARRTAPAPRTVRRP